MDKEMTVQEHLNELRKRLMWVIIPIIVIFFVMFALSDHIINFLLNNYNISATLLSPLEYLDTQMTISLNLTLLFLIPMVLTQIYLFAKPVIKKEHRKSIIRYVGLSSVIAVLGLAFAYFIFIPQTFDFFKNSNGGLVNMWGLKSIFDYINLMLISFAIIFQVAVIIPALDKINLINVESIKKYRTLIILICFTIAGIVTPSISVVPQVMMAVPLYSSFEVGLLLSKLNRRKKWHLEKQKY